MSRKDSEALSFHNSHIKWILYIYSVIHLLTAGAAIYIFCVLRNDFMEYSPIIYGFATIEAVLAAECFVIRPFLKRFYKSGLFLLYLYLFMRLAVNLAAATYLIITFPHMFPDFFSMITNFGLEYTKGGYTIAFIAPIFIICLSNLFLCTTSLVYYIRKSNAFK